MISCPDVSGLCPVAIQHAVFAGSFTLSRGSCCKRHFGLPVHQRRKTGNSSAGWLLPVWGNMGPRRTCELARSLSYDHAARNAGTHEISETAVFWPLRDQSGGKCRASHSAASSVVCNCSCCFIQVAMLCCNAGILPWSRRQILLVVALSRHWCRVCYQAQYCP